MSLFNGTMVKDTLGAQRGLRCDDEGNLCIVPTQAGLPTQKFLTTNGITTGNRLMNADFSVAATDFYHLATSRYEVASLLLQVSDNANFNQTDFGAIAGGITNGIKFFFATPAVEIPLFSGLTVKQNYEWLEIAHDITLTTFAGTSQTLIIHLALLSSYGRPFTINAGQKFIIRVNDNLSSLVSMTAQLRGVYY